MKVAVTGAGGYLGRALVDRLLASGFEPFAIVKKESDVREYKEKGIDSICRDLSKENDYAGLFGGCKAMVHCAALRRDYGRWEDFKRTNIDITRRVMECASNENLEKIVHISRHRYTATTEVITGRTKKPITAKEWWTITLAPKLRPIKSFPAL